MVKGFFKTFWPVGAIALISALIFFKIFQKGLYPIPADLLVSFYFPWYSGGWVGYDPWTTHKEMLGADAIRQIYLWKEFAMQQFILGRFPLWNPFTFSGQPLLANFQSSVFYPFNIFYLLTDAKNAWILLITIQPFLAGIFMFICLRSFKLSKVPALFGSTAFMFSSYFITWMENGNVSHSYLWLPFAIFSINRFFERYKIRYLIVLTAAIVLAIFAGHPQTVIYIILATALFFLFKIFNKNKNPKLFLYYCFALLGALLISAIQLAPTFSLYKISPIHLPFAKDVFERSILPIQNLVTFFASDFFGHPASNNFWSVSYGDFTPYFGVVPLVFSLWGIFKLFGNKFIKFATFTSAFFVLAAVNGPITFLIKKFQLPIIDATSPSRFISITIFFLIIVSAFGFSDFLKNIKSKKYLQGFLKFLGIVFAVYSAMWGFTIFGKIIFQKDPAWQINLSVTQRNLLLPTVMFLTVPALALFVIAAKKLFKSYPENLIEKAVISVIFLTTLTGGVYYSNKFLPVAPKKFIFPEHPIFTWLEKNAGINRFYGSQTARVDYNFPTHYKVYGVEGYDTLRFERYAQLLASIPSGQIPLAYLRSDASIPDDNNNLNKKRILDLLGVKYLLDKEDNPKTGADWHYERYPVDNLQGLVQYTRAQIYLRKDALPRIFMTTKYTVAKSDNEILSNIYNRNFDLSTVILEQEPPILIENSQANVIIPQVISYLPNESIIKTNSNSNSLLFISDAYSDDWKAYIDNIKSPLLRADYALRAVAVPKGEHKVRFQYEPVSFKVGLFITLLALTATFILSSIAITKKRF